jgi:hypothetical protein
MKSVRARIQSEIRIDVKGISDEEALRITTAIQKMVLCGIEVVDSTINKEYKIFIITPVVYRDIDTILMEFSLVTGLQII